ncbi:MAG TPA: hypothetical protein DDW52_22835 [Planctomycetaceae bacterium]|nr:hypothetical protein [Planctomycetaceae bacterium]
MKLSLQILAGLLIVGGIAYGVRIGGNNRDVAAEIAELESVVGRFEIENEDRVHIIAIENPQIAPEVRQRIDRVWQFAIYRPAGYDCKLHCSQFVASDGVRGLHGELGVSPTNSDRSTDTLTVSLVELDDRLDFFYSFSGFSGTLRSYPVRQSANSDALVVKTLVGNREPARSFDRDTVLSILKVYDPNSPAEAEIAGDTADTFTWASFVLCPASREQEFEALSSGDWQAGVSTAETTTRVAVPDWIAQGAQREK